MCVEIGASRRSIGGLPIYIFYIANTQTHTHMHSHHTHIKSRAREWRKHRKQTTKQTPLLGNKSHTLFTKQSPIELSIKWRQHSATRTAERNHTHTHSSRYRALCAVYIRQRRRRDGVVVIVVVVVIVGS